MLKPLFRETERNIGSLSLVAFLLFGYASPQHWLEL